MLIEFGWPWPTMMLNGTWTNAIWRSGPASAGSDLHEQRALGQVLLAGRHRLRRLVDDAGQDVVVEVLAHARQVDGRLDAELPCSCFGVADAGQQQQLGRFDRAAADDDLARSCVCARWFRPPLLVLDARRSGRPR